ncbi:ATP-grasp domain-containing protein [Streptomyces noursei]|nr:ATP-grasp domain-containing protein [Streptomyces noursei]EXU92368.1 D-alanine--D-alanine ligase [Streptomyces noursei PD-1]UWS69853.1 ATP-grasp domain-containing protein [Streptomyces noursei]UWS76928.1 ATP-grasp domain-containing protein [Streptomyces noursei]
MSGMDVVVLAGGESAERFVSLASGTEVARALAGLGCNVRLVDPADVEAPLGRPWEESAFAPVAPMPGPPDPAERQRLARHTQTALTRPDLLERLRRADCAFFAIHGGWGGSGHMQSVLDIAGVRYTGPRPHACAAAWDKDRAISRVSAAGVRVTRRVKCTPGDTDHAAEALGLLEHGPVVVKPAAGGSGIELGLMKDEPSLMAALSKSGEDRLVEEYLPGREFSVGVLGDRALPVVEIAVAGPVYDYSAKYSGRGVLRECPAQIPEALTRELEHAALQAHFALTDGTRSYSRVDFRCDGEGRPVFLELNALPAFTQTSLLPLAASKDGCSFPQLIRRIVALAPESTGLP